MLAPCYMQLKLHILDCVYLLLIWVHYKL